MCITTMYAMIYIYIIVSTFYNIIKVILCLFIAQVKNITETFFSNIVKY